MISAFLLVHGEIPMNSMGFVGMFWPQHRRLSDAGDRRGEGANGGQAWRWSPWKWPKHSE